jgi:hypothetical protein
MPWIDPTLWTAGEVPTASSMNTRTRDPLIWLHDALELITDGTIDDSGTDTYLSITSAAGGGTLLRGLRAGDEIARVQISTDGLIKWGSGVSADGWDVSIARESARILRVEDAQFRVYRDDNDDPALAAHMTGESFARAAIHPGFMELLEGSAPNTPSSDRVRWYARDQAGKTQLVALFDDGSIVQIAIQP